MAENLGLLPTSLEVLTLMAFLYFKTSKVDVALLEVEGEPVNNPTNICLPKIAAITRISTDNPATTDATLRNMVEIVKKGLM